MNKIGRRAFVVILIACVVLGGMGVYISSYVTNGEDWALYFSMKNSGANGEILDRNGVPLAFFNSTVTTYSESELTRKACYHITGDYWGRIPTGCLTVYREGMREYNIFTGTTKEQDTYLNLTVDSKMCEVAYQALGEDRDGAIMVMNYRTGDVLCMVSGPSTDPLDSNAELREGTFINKCISGSFVPGSSFKLVTSAAAIETIPDIFSRSFFCDNEYEIAGVPIGCTGPHYTQSFEKALANSCNIAFAQIAVMVGQNTLAEYAEKYGFLDKHTLDGISTAAGNFPTEFVGDPETAWAGIGQSTDLVCPYTLLRYVAAIANGGVLVEPHIVAGQPKTETELVRADTAEKLTYLMKNNVTDHYEPETRFPGLPLAAKTGTGETGTGTSHAWFSGFLYDEAHPYAFVVLIENGGSGLKAAGDVANQVLQYAMTITDTPHTANGAQSAEDTENPQTENADP